MTARKSFHRITIATLLVLTLLIAPAVPAAADEVGGGWTQGITEWVSNWITSWQSPAKTNADGDFQKRATGARHLIGPAPEFDEGDDYPNFNLPEIVHSTQEEQSCDAYPENDPLGQC